MPKIARLSWLVDLPESEDLGANIDRYWAAPGELQRVLESERLAYSRKQAAEALGVSIPTIDRRVVPAVRTVKTPRGQRLIPAAELRRFIDRHPSTMRVVRLRTVGE